MSREQLEGINPRLLAFMTHDRVTLAGTVPVAIDGHPSEALAGDSSAYLAG